MAIFQQGAFTLDPKDTPDSIRKKRAMIQQLIMPYGKASNIGEGVAQLFNGIGTGMQNRKLDKIESAGQASGATARENIYNMLSGGNSAPIGQGPFPDAPSAPSQSSIFAPNKAVADAMMGKPASGNMQDSRALDRVSMAGYSSDVRKANPDYRASLIGTESGGNFAARNNEIGAGGKAGHFGRVQFGQARLQEAMNAGAIPQGMTPQQFMASPEAQIAAENWHFGDLEKRLSPYVGSIVNGQNLDLGSLVAIGHLGGAGGAEKYIKTGGRYNPSDSFGTSLADYAKKHSGKTGVGTEIASLSNAYSPPMPAMARPQTQEVQVASLDPSVGMQSAYAPTTQPTGAMDALNGMSQQPMYTGQVNPNGTISTAVQGQQPSSAPQPQQIAQAAPQVPQGVTMDAGTPFERQGQPQGMDLGALMKEAQNLWLDDNTRSMLNGMIEREMQKNDPAYQQNQRMQELEMQRVQLELQQMQNPKADTVEIGGRLINRQTGEVVYEPPIGSQSAAMPSNVQEYEYFSKLTPDQQRQYLAVKRSQQTMDLGTGVGILDQTNPGQLSNTIPKNNEQEAFDKNVGAAQGKIRGEAISGASQAATQASEGIRLIDDMIADPGLDSIVGNFQGRLPAGIPLITGGQQGMDAASRMSQLQGRAFLQAFESLKGGGQITEIEGQKATDAMARLNRAQSPEAFKQSLSEVRAILELGLSRASALGGQSGQIPRGQTQAAQPAPAPQGEKKRLKFNPQTGELE